MIAVKQIAGMKNKKRHNFLSIGIGLVLLMCILHVKAEQNLSADTVIRNVSDSLLVLAKKYKNEPNTEALQAEIQKIMLPLVDYDKVLRGVLAAHYDKVTLEQKEKMKELFKDALVRLYVKSIGKLQNQKIEVLPAKLDEDTQKAKVTIEIKNSDGSQIPITYVLHKNEQGQWLTYNVLFAGINYVLTYRNLFAATLRKYSGDVEKTMQELYNVPQSQVTTASVE